MAQENTKFYGRYKFWSDKAVEAFSKAGVELHFKKGDGILNPMAENQSVYLIESGIVNMRFYTKEGNVVTVLQKHPGDMFGIKSLFKYSTEKNFYSMAATAVTCWKVNHQDFMNLMENDKEFAVNILEYFVTYVDIIERKMLDSAFMTTYQKLVMSLLDNAKDLADDNTAIVFETQQEIGTLISATRQTVAAYLTILEENGWVEVKRGKILIKDKAALEGELI